MALQLQLNIRADAAQFGATIQGAEAQVRAATGRMTTGLDAASAASRGTAQSLLSVGAAMRALATGVIARQVLDYADAWTSVRGRLALVTASTDDLARVTGGLFDVAQKTRSSFEGTADLYARMARATRQLGLDENALLRITQTINEATAISGASAASAEAALFQLGQAMASGALRGDEFNSVLEQTPRLAEAIAAGMGTGIGGLRRLAEAGQLTSEAVITALTKQAGAVDAEYRQLAPTVQQAWTTMNNAILRYVGEADTATGASATLARGITGLAENFGTVVTVAAGAGAALATIYAGRGVAAGVTLLTRAIDDQRVALYANAVAAAEAASIEKLRAAQDLITAQARVTATTATRAAATADYAAATTAQGVAAADLAAADAALTRAKAKVLLTTNVYAANAALAAERAAQAAVTVASNAATIATTRQTAALEALRVAQGAETAAALAVADANVAVGNAAIGSAAATAALARPAGLASAAFAGLRTAGAGLLAMLGGPVGAAFTAVTAAVLYFSTRETTAEKLARQHAEALRDLSRAADGAGKSLANAANGLSAADINDFQVKINSNKATLADARKDALESGYGEDTLAAYRLLRYGDEERAIMSIQRQFGQGSLSANQYRDALAKVANAHADDASLQSYVNELTDAAKGYVVAEDDIKAYENALRAAREPQEAIAIGARATAAAMVSLGDKIAQVVEKTRLFRLPPGLDRQTAELAGPPPADTYAQITNGAQDRGVNASDTATQAYKSATAVLRTRVDAAMAAEADDLVRKTKAAATAEAEYQRAVGTGNPTLIARARAQKEITLAVAEGQLPESKAADQLRALSDLYGAEVAGSAAAATTQLSLAARAAIAAGDAWASAGNGADDYVAAQAAVFTAEAAAAAAADQLTSARDHLADAGAKLYAGSAEAATDLAAEAGWSQKVADATRDGVAAKAEMERQHQVAKDTQTATAAANALEAAGLTDLARRLRDTAAAYDLASKAAAEAAQAQVAADAILSAKDDLAYAQAELALMDESEQARDRALRSIRIQQQATLLFKDVSTDALRQQRDAWIALQGQIADTEALTTAGEAIRQTAREMSQDISGALYDAITNRSKSSGVVDFFKTLFKKIATAALEQKIVLPIVTPIVSAVTGTSALGAAALGAAGVGTATGGGGATTGGGSLDLLSLSRLAGSGSLPSWWNQDVLGPSISPATGVPIGSESIATGGGLGVSWGQLATGAGSLFSAYNAFNAFSSGRYGSGAGSLISSGLGIAQLAGVSMGALGPIGMIAAPLIGSLFDGLFADKQYPWGQVASKGGSVYAVESLDGYDTTQLAKAGDQAAATLASLAKTIGITAASLPQAGIGYSQDQRGTLGAGYYSFVGGGGFAATDAKTFGSADEAVADYIKRSLAGADLTGVSDAVRTVLSSSALTSLTDLTTALGLAQQIEDATAGLDGLDKTLGGLAASAKKAAASTYDQLQTSVDLADKAGIGQDYRDLLTRQLRAAFDPAVTTFTTMETAVAQLAGQADAAVDAIQKYGLSISETEIRADQAAKVQAMTAEYDKSFQQTVNAVRGTDLINTMSGFIDDYATRVRDLAALGQSAAPAIDLLGAQYQATLAGVTDIGKLTPLLTAFSGAVGDVMAVFVKARIAEVEVEQTGPYSDLAERQKAAQVTLGQISQADYDRYELDRKHQADLAGVTDQVVRARILEVQALEDQAFALSSVTTSGKSLVDWLLGKASTASSGVSATDAYQTSWAAYRTDLAAAEGGNADALRLTTDADRLLTAYEGLYGSSGLQAFQADIMRQVAGLGATSAAAQQQGLSAVVDAIKALPHAGGGPASGLTMINDAGPELVRLPTGSYVMTAAATRSFLRGTAPANDGTGAVVAAISQTTRAVVETGAGTAEAVAKVGQRLSDLEAENARLRTELRRVADRLDGRRSA